MPDPRTHIHRGRRPVASQSIGGLEDVLLSLTARERREAPSPARTTRTARPTDAGGARAGPLRGREACCATASSSSSRSSCGPWPWWAWYSAPRPSLAPDGGSTSPYPESSRSASSRPAFTSQAITSGFDQPLRRVAGGRGHSAQAGRKHSSPRRCSPRSPSRSCRSGSSFVLGLALGWRPRPLGRAVCRPLRRRRHVGLRGPGPAARRHRCAPRRCWPSPTSSGCCCSSGGGVIVPRSAAARRASRRSWRVPAVGRARRRTALGPRRRHA